MRRDLMAAKDVFAEALEEVLEEWDGSGEPEDVLERALSASTEAEHGRRLLRHRKRLRNEHEASETPEEEAREHEGYEDEEEEDELPPLE